MFCNLSELRNESDVEQKFVMPMLRAAFPQGTGFGTAEIYTKSSIHHLTIGKGPSSKVYRPDYIILLDGIPVAAVEAKSPAEDVLEGLREARLYAAELNALYPAGMNPCTRVMACNGHSILTSTHDHAEPDCNLSFSDCTPTSEAYHRFLSLFSRSTLQETADDIVRRLRKQRYWRAQDLLGGLTARDEDVGYNSFGKDLAFEFEHIFNPSTQAQRANIVRNAYVTSKRRRHYVDEIDRIVHRAVPAKPRAGTVIEDTASPSELLKLLRRGNELQNKLLLLVGGVGSGKSTFIDYFREVKMDPVLSERSVWVHVDVNNSPKAQDSFERWTAERIVHQLRSKHVDIDFDDPAVVRKVYSVELHALEKRVLSQLPADSPKRSEMLAAEIHRLDSDSQSYAKALARHLCAERGKLLVIVMDNCDKGDADGQLMTFQIVKWLQSWLTCLVFLPLRDVTYDVHRTTPPLDTVIKDYVFRIEPPPFTFVLRKRIDLALAELRRSGGHNQHSYTLENGATVVYPTSDLGVYLGCLYKSLFEHDALLRKMLVGLADRDVRRAIEIFIEFCKSGHINDGEIFKIRMAKGEYALPYSVVARVLLRINRRFYDGSSAIIKNLFQCDPDDPAPSNWSRYSILKWLEGKWSELGPTRVKGFHQAASLIEDLAALGIDSRVLREDLRYLVESGCIATEHQRRELKSDADLVSLSASGRAHLQFCSNVQYLAACAEDTWMADDGRVRAIAKRIGSGGRRRHFRQTTQAKNAKALVEYLFEDPLARGPVLKVLKQGFVDPGRDIAVLRKEVVERYEATISKYGWKDALTRFAMGTKCWSTVMSAENYAVLVKLDDGPVGRMHASQFPEGRDAASFSKGERIVVEVLSIDEEEERIDVAAATL